MFEDGKEIKRFPESEENMQNFRKKNSY